MQKALGKTIRLSLVDGSASGAIVAEIINWTGQVVTVPRAQLHEMAKREELQRTGVYALVGADPHTAAERIYIGEGDAVFERLKAHDADSSKDFWTRAVVVTSKDFNLTKAHARHLEGRLIDLATRAGRARVSNTQTPGPKTLPESDVADMEYFIEQVRLMLPALGFDFLRPLATLAQPADAALTPLLRMAEVGAAATAREVDGTFVVLAGSTARRTPSPSWDSYVALRQKLIDQEKLVLQNPELYAFATDVEFTSPSAAAAVVAAANRNGRLAWKLANGQSYGEWKALQVRQAES